MIQSRRFALGFRLAALLFACIGVMAQIGVFKGAVGLGSFMYYTIQSNLLAIVLFTLLVVKTVQSLRESTRGGSGWFPRFEMVCTVNVLVTLIVFWALLAGRLSLSYLFSFENLAVHTITPLLCLVDYLLFTKAGHLKYRDVYLTCIYPLFYVVFTSVAGLLGYVYYYQAAFGSTGDVASLGAPVRFPYFFLDFDRIGLMALAFIAGIAVFIIILGHGMFLLDKKIRRQ